MSDRSLLYGRRPRHARVARQCCCVHPESCRVKAHAYAPHRTHKPAHSGIRGQSQSALYPSTRCPGQTAIPNRLDTVSLSASSMTRSLASMYSASSSSSESCAWAMATPSRHPLRSVYRNPLLLSPVIFRADYNSLSMSRGQKPLI